MPKKIASVKPKLEELEVVSVLVLCINPAQNPESAPEGVPTREEVPWFCSVPALGICFIPTPGDNPVFGYWDSRDARQYVQRHIEMAVRNPDYIRYYREHPEYLAPVENSGFGKIMPILVSIPENYLTEGVLHEPQQV